MEVKLDAGSNRFPAVISVDADKRGDAVTLIFNTRIEGQGAPKALNNKPCNRMSPTFQTPRGLLLWSRSGVDRTSRRNAGLGVIDPSDMDAMRPYGCYGAAGRRVT
jgi:hypothetical protein